MDENIIDLLIEEIRNEQHPIEDDKTLTGYIKRAEYDINDIAGAKIDYTKDLKARGLLKDFVLYARHNRIAEFKELYGGEYVNLQAKYYKPTSV